MIQLEELNYENNINHDYSYHLLKLKQRTMFIFTKRLKNNSIKKEYL